MNINLHIERLILDGIDLGPAQRQQLRAAVEQELVRLLGAGTPLTQIGGAVPSISTPAIEQHNNPKEFGKQIAGSVYGGIGK